MVLAGIGLGVGTFLIIFFSVVCILSTVYSRMSRTTAPFLVGLSMLIIIILCLILLPKQSAVTTTAGVNIRTDANQAALWGPIYSPQTVYLGAVGFFIFLFAAFGILGCALFEGLDLKRARRIPGICLDGPHKGSVLGGF